MNVQITDSALRAFAVNAGAAPGSKIDVGAMRDNSDLSVTPTVAWPDPASPDRIHVLCVFGSTLSVNRKRAEDIALAMSSAGTPVSRVFVAVVSANAEILGNASQAA